MSHLSLALIPTLIAALFVTGWGMRLLDPILPVLARDFGVAVGDAAPLVSAFALAYGVGQVVVGVLGSRFGKLRVLCLALVLYAVISLCCSLALGLSTMAGLRAATGLAAGAIFPLALAWVGDTVPYAERQAVIGRLLMGMVLAQLFAGPVSGAMAQYLGWRAVFVLVGVGALLAAVVLAWRLGRETWMAPVASGQGGLGLSEYPLLLKRRDPRRLMIASFVDGFCLFGGAFPFVGSYLIEVFRLSSAQAGLCVAGFGLGALVYTRTAKRLVGRFGEARLLLSGGLALGCGFGLMALAPGWWMVALAQAGMGLAFFMLHGVLQARSTEALPEARAISVSGFVMALFLGQCLGSLVFGQIIGGAGYRWGFAVAALGVAGLGLWAQWRLVPGRGQAAPG